MLSVKDNPPVQSPAEWPFEDFPGKWWVARTKPRQEKALAWEIFRSGGHYFLPMYTVTRTSRGRRWETVLVLFSGYVFVCCNEDERVELLRTGRVANLIDVVDSARLVSELTSIRRLLETKLAIDPYPQLQAGTRCRIRSGSMIGLEGRVDMRKSPSRFVIEVTTLGQGVAVEIDAGLLEPVDPA